jgi:arsenate reductase
MAEGLARHFGKGIIEPFSAGLMPVGVNPFAVKVMKEIGIDISNQTSDPIKEDLLRQMDVIITLCRDAEASCPTTPPEIKRIHWPIDDPVGTTGTDEEIINAFRLTRDEIKQRILEFIDRIKGEQA